MFLNDMAQYPEVQDRLREEINAKQAGIGGKNAIFTQQDYDSMPYLNAVLKASSFASFTFSLVLITSLLGIHETEPRPRANFQDQPRRRRAPALRSHTRDRR